MQKYQHRSLVWYNHIAVVTLLLLSSAGAVGLVSDPSAPLVVLHFALQNQFWLVTVLLFLIISNAFSVAPYFGAVQKLIYSSCDHQEVHWYVETHFYWGLHPVSPSFLGMA